MGAKKILKIIPFTPDLSVILIHVPGAEQEIMVCIKQNERICNRPAEILLNPEELQLLRNALAEAAEEIRNFAPSRVTIN